LSDTATELEELLGDAVSVDEATIERASHDHSARALLAQRGRTASAGPQCVVTPSSTEQVSELLAWANDRRVAIVPFGGGSGVCDAILPDSDSVVVDLSGLDRVVDIDTKSGLVTAEAGVYGNHLARVLSEQGLMLGHQPQSLGISTLGGWIATRACGQLSARFGGIEELLVGLQAVLPSGKVATKQPNPRASLGPDVAGLMIGSEGTLGIVTQATMRVADVPVDRADTAIVFEHMADGVAACRLLARSDLHPTLVRLYDREDVSIAFRNTDAPDGCLLLLSFDGDLAEQRAGLASGMAGGQPARASLVEHWWLHRNDAVATYQEVMRGEGPLGPHALVDTMEVSGTWAGLRDLYHDIKTGLAEHAGLVGCHLSHIYPDGACLYFTILGGYEDDAAAAAALDKWWEIGMTTCLERGGGLSHHHGIGRLKAGWLREALGEWYDVLVAVKKAIDPNRIMNPGALGL
jgi:alkyldihydroxyacetonephosphate synthase